jgi:Protein of unknown function (DUF3106)
MNWVARIGVGLAALLGAGRLACAATPDPGAVSRPVSEPANSASARLRMPRPPEPPDTAPPVPRLSPVQFFRELLAMSPAEIKLALSNRTPTSRQLILAKLHEYAAMDPDRRALRLQVTEMQWYLQPLLVAPATNRAALLATVPRAPRELIEGRLSEWDKLPPDVQKELVANKDTLSYLTELEGLTDEQRHKMVEGLSPARRQQLQAGIEQWNSMSNDQRRTMVSRFNQFFDLTPAEKDKALRSLSPEERRQIQKTLQTFGNLPPDQRARCVRAIEKYTTLSLAERQQFLKNAERWQSLTPSQRQVWRDLVNHLPPPLPPDFPPMPTLHRTAQAVPAVVTNGD